MHAPPGSEDSVDLSESLPLIGNRAQNERHDSHVEHLVLGREAISDSIDDFHRDRSPLCIGLSEVAEVR
jgi:hypothetical protein